MEVEARLAERRRLRDELLLHSTEGPVMKLPVESISTPLKKICTKLRAGSVESIKVVAEMEERNVAIKGLLVIFSPIRIKEFFSV